MFCICFTLATKVILTEYANECQELVHFTQVEDGAVVQLDYAGTMVVECGFIRNTKREI